VDASVDELTAVLKGDADWEGVLFAVACAGARELARQFLEALDTALAAGGEPGWQVVGYRQRTVLTRFGPVRVRRRLYRRGRQRRFLLDEALGWSPHQRVTPRLRALLVELASYLPYGRAAALAEQFGVAISGATLRRQLQAVGEAATAQEAAQRTAVYAAGQPPPLGEQPADPLFVEADGVLIPLQRASERRAELKVAIAYRGTQAVGRDRHRRVRRATVGTVHYASGEDAETFWESAWLAFGARYDLARTAQVVLGGDGAEWIRGGLPPDGRGLFQLDRFHLARACRRRLKADGAAAYAAARTGDTPTLQARLAAAWAAATTDRRRAKLTAFDGYLTTNADGLVDWWRRAPLPAPAPHGLGAMEANIDKPYARRLKRRGMSWSRRGLHAMAKVLQLRENGELPATAQAPPGGPPAPTRRAASAASTAPPAGLGAAPPFQARFAPRWGPHAARPWVRALARWLS
jgi:hypothetical protein